MYRSPCDASSWSVCIFHLLCVFIWCILVIVRWCAFVHFFFFVTFEHYSTMNTCVLKTRAFIHVWDVRVWFLPLLRWCHPDVKINNTSPQACFITCLHNVLMLCNAPFWPCYLDYHYWMYFLINVESCQWRWYYGHMDLLFCGNYVYVCDVNIMNYDHVLITSLAWKYNS